VCEIDATPLLYIVMEHAEEDLSQVIPLRPLTAAEAGEMLLPVVDVLSFIHEKGFVHGHIRPSNIMVVDNQLKLSSDSIHTPDELGSALEPSVYNAPEAATEAVTRASDVFSLGVTLVTALTQHLPAWEQSEPGELILPESVPEPFRAIARECLLRDPGERCTLADIKARLQPPAAPLKKVEEPAAPVKEPADQIVRPKRHVVALIVSVVIVLAVLAGVRLVRHHGQTPSSQTTGAEEKSQAGIVQRPSSSRAPEATIKISRAVVAQGAVAKRVLPDVPQNARNTIRGNVKVGVRVSVSPVGNVLAATLDSPGPSRYFANLALQAARDWKFEPPQIDGHSVSSEWILRFQFGRIETQVAPVEVAP
jgi:TonB family protein